MRLLFLGDIVGNAGRDAVVKMAPQLRDELGLDYLVANGENIAGGRGITPKHAEQLFDAGVDVITGGNHTFQHRELYQYLESTDGILRPLNYPPGAPGRGVAEVDGLMVVNLIGRVFMGADYDDPFRAADVALEGVGNRFVLVDMHAEATSEKQAMGWHLDGRATLVVGTHTHVPTADCRILPGGTAYCTDAGMCGARDSIIGDDVQAVLARFRTQMPTRLPAAEGGPAVINGVLVEADDTTKRAVSITRCDRVVC